MAGTITISRALQEGTRPAEQFPDRIEIAWVSDASGNANGTPTKGIFGTLLKVQFKPDSGGTQPTDGYDATLTDTAGIDVLAGQGANLSNSTATQVIPGVPLKDGTTTSVGPCAVADALTLNISNAGSAKGGKVILYVR